jgi:hypothetical protein
MKKFPFLGATMRLDGGSQGVRLKMTDVSDQPWSYLVDGAKRYRSTHKTIGVLSSGTRVPGDDLACGVLGACVSKGCSPSGLTFPPGIV